MKKALLLVSFLASFATTVSAAESAPLKTESVAQASVSTVKKHNQQIIQRETGNSRVTRHLSKDKIKRTNIQAVTASKPTYRDETPLESTRSNAYAFSIYDAWTYLDQDPDGDGFYDEFTVEFDVDNSEGYANVYAEMYLSLNGGPWVHFYTTDVFSINGETSDDYYSVSTLLNSNFPTGYYDVAIDIYEAGYSGRVATAGPLDFYDLSSLPLEDMDHEYNEGDTRITYVASTISDDYDNDGFYTTLSLEYDIDTYDAGRMAFARIDITNVDTFERTTLETDDFQIGNQTELLDILLDSGEFAGWYNINITLVDSYNQQQLAIASQEFSALYELPLESVSNDNYYDDPDAGNGGSTSVVVVHESGGGAMGWWFALSLILLIVAQKRYLKLKKG